MRIFLLILIGINVLILISHVTKNINYQQEEGLFIKQVVREDISGSQINDISGSQITHVFNDSTVVRSSLLIDRKEAYHFLNETVRGCNPRKKLCLLYEEQCQWCNYDNKCINGTTRIGGMVEERIKLFSKELRMYVISEYAFKNGAWFPNNNALRRRKNRWVVFNGFSIECTLDNPITDPKGYMLLPWRKRKEKTILRLPIGLSTNKKEGGLLLNDKKEEATLNNIVICGRALYGDIQASTIIKHVQHHIDKGISKIILYDVGMAFIDDRNMLEPYIDKGLLELVDLRDEMQRLYGAGAFFTIMSSFAMGQYWLKQECQLRAKAQHYEWALHIDLDEYVHVNGSITTFIKHRGKDKEWLSIGSMSITSHNNSGVFECSKQDLYRICPDSYGRRKLFVRTSMEPLSLRIHRVRKVLKKLGTHLDVHDIHIKHLRYMNQAPPFRNEMSTMVL